MILKNFSLSVLLLGGLCAASMKAASPNGGERGKMISLQDALEMSASQDGLGGSTTTGMKNLLASTLLKPFVRPARVKDTSKPEDGTTAKPPCRQGKWNLDEEEEEEEDKVTSVIKEVGLLAMVFILVVAVVCCLSPKPWPN